MLNFKNREEAGSLLADKLNFYQKESPLVLAIPRGGVPVAKVVAESLQAQLDILVVKKIGAPGNPELAIGAVSEDGRPWFNSRVVGLIGIKTASLRELAEDKAAEVRVQVRRLRAGRSAIPMQGRTVILIDDGIATGATLLAAINLVRSYKPRKIVVATPIAPPSTLEEVQREVDDVICLMTPFPFMSVGDWYRDFRQVSDEEVIRLLGQGRFLGGPDLSQ